MWSSQIQTLNSDRIQKISIFSHNRQVTYSEVIELWQQDEIFRSFFSSLLASATFPAYFWETPSVTITNVHRLFEFVLVDSPHLARVSPDPISFQQHFELASPQEEIITFPNLSQDALLVVPCPAAEGNPSTGLAHIASFVREAPQSQQHALWQTVGTVLKQRLNRHPIWVSTSGLGVYWLHIRLDSYPKYYTFKPYRFQIEQY